MEELLRMDTSEWTDGELIEQKEELERLEEELNGWRFELYLESLTA